MNEKRQTCWITGLKGKNNNLKIRYEAILGDGMRRDGEKSLIPEGQLCVSCVLADK